MLITFITLYIIYGVIAFITPYIINGIIPSLTLNLLSKSNSIVNAINVHTCR